MPVTVFLYTIFYVDNLCRYFGNIISILFVVNFSQEQKDKENMKIISKYMCELKCQPIRNKNYLWWPCLLTDRYEISKLYRGHAIDASYQVSVHLVKRFQRRRFLKIGQSETRINTETISFQNFFELNF
jgi:hypothetical protein